MPSIKISKDPVFIENLEKLKELEPSLGKTQVVQYNCTECNTTVQKALYRIIKFNYNLLCYHCQSKKTSLEKYGTEWPSKSKIYKEKVRKTLAGKTTEEKRRIIEKCELPMN